MGRSRKHLVFVWGIHGGIWFRYFTWYYTLINEGSLVALKEPLWLFFETRGSFDDVGFF